VTRAEGIMGDWGLLGYLKDHGIDISRTTSGYSIDALLMERILKLEERIAELEPKIEDRQPFDTIVGDK
jgi:hypothetical protein